MEPAITQLLFRDIRGNDRTTPDKWIQPLQNARFIGKKQFSLRSVRSDAGQLSSLFMKNLEVIEWAE
jgi:hypothetical protein